MYSFKWDYCYGLKHFVRYTSSVTLILLCIYVVFMLKEISSTEKIVRNKMKIKSEKDANLFPL